MREETETPLLVRFSPVVEKQTPVEKKKTTRAESEETARRDLPAREKVTSPPPGVPREIEDRQGLRPPSPKERPPSFTDGRIADPG